MTLGLMDIRGDTLVGLWWCSSISTSNLILICLLQSRILWYVWEDSPSAMRIKANPTRMTKEHGEVLTMSSATEPTTSSHEASDKIADKSQKAYSDFSISSQLKKPPKNVVPAAINLGAAQKVRLHRGFELKAFSALQAYEELLRGLEKQEQFVATAMSFFNAGHPLSGLSAPATKAASASGSKRSIGGKQELGVRFYRES